MLHLARLIAGGFLVGAFITVGGVLRVYTYYTTEGTPIRAKIQYFVVTLGMFLLGSYVLGYVLDIVLKGYLTNVLRLLGGN